MTDPIQDGFENILAKKESEAEALSDKGHAYLIEDLQQILKDAESGKYHDFHRNGEDAPKVALAGELQWLRQCVINGKYDN